MADAETKGGTDAGTEEDKAAKGEEEKAPDKKDGEAPEETGDKAGSSAITVADKGASSMASVVAATRLNEAARTIATAVRGVAGTRTIVVVEDRNVAVSDIVLSEVSSTLAALQTVLERVEAVVTPPRPTRPARREVIQDRTQPPEEAGGEGAAPEGGGEPEPSDQADPLDALTKLTEIVGLFRSTFEVTPQAITLDRTALIAEIAGTLREESPKKRVVIPTMAWVAEAPILELARMLIARREVTAVALSQLRAVSEPDTARLNHLRAYRDAIVAARLKAVQEGKSEEAGRLKAELDATDQDIKSIAERDVFQRVAARVKAAESMLNAFDARFEAVATATSAGTSPLVQAALREQIHRLAEISDVPVESVASSGLAASEADRTDALDRTQQDQIDGPRGYEADQIEAPRGYEADQIDASRGYEADQIEASRGYEADQIESSGGTAILWVDITATGGDSVNKNSALGWNSEIAFLGAAQAVYLLVDTNGSVLSGGAEASFGHQTFDFEGFFADASTRHRPTFAGLRYEVAEALAVGIILIVAVVLVALII